AGRRQAFEDVAQPGIGLLPVGLGGFDQAVDLRAGRRTLGCVAEQPVLAPDDERADGVLGAVVVDRQLPALDVAHQFAPVAGQVVHRLAQSGLPSNLRLGLVQPGLELLQQWPAALLSVEQSSGFAGVLQVTLDTVELVDQVQRHVGAPGLALWLHLSCVDDFASGMRPAAQLFAAIPRTHGVMAGVRVRHQAAAIAVQQAQWSLLCAAGAVIEEADRALRRTTALYPRPGRRAAVAAGCLQPPQTG